MSSAGQTPSARQLLNRRRLTKDQLARLDAVNAAIARRDAPPASLRIVIDRRTGSTLDLMKAPSFRKKRSNPTDDAVAEGQREAVDQKQKPGQSRSADRAPVKRVLRLKPEYVRKLQEADDDRARVAAVLGIEKEKETRNVDALRSTPTGKPK